MYLNAAEAAFEIGKPVRAKQMLNAIRARVGMPAKQQATLANIKNETLIIWGDKDTAYNFEQVNILNKNLPNSKMEIFKGCSHNVHLENPEKFNEIVKNFLQN